MDSIAVANWDVKDAGGGNVTARNTVTGGQFFGTKDAFNVMIKGQVATKPVEFQLRPGEVPLTSFLLGPGVAKITAGEIEMSAQAWSLVSSRPLCPEAARSDAQNFTSRVLCVLPHSVSALKLVYANFYSRTTGNGECPFPNPIQIRASITPATAIANESTPNVGYEVLFSARRTKTLGRGSIVESGAVKMFGLAGTPVYIKTWVSCEIPDAPAAPALAQAASGGMILNGTYKVALTVVYPDDGMESKASAGTSITLTGGTSTQKIDVTAPAVVPGAIGYRVWVTAAGGAEPYYDAGCGIVPFSRNAVVYNLPNVAANWDTAEIVLPSTPMLFPVSYGALLGGTNAGGVGSGEGSVSGYDTTAQSTGLAIGGGAGAYASYGPVAILGLTSGELASVAITGDSIADGAHDMGHGGVSGFIARGAQLQFGRKFDPSIVPPVGLVAVSQGSETTDKAADSRFNRRLQLALLARSVVSDHCTNSLASGSPFIAAMILTAADRFINAGKRYFHTTCTPRHISSDGYMSMENYAQSWPIQEGARRQINAWLRDTTDAGRVENEIPLRAASGPVPVSFDFYGPGDGAAVYFCTRSLMVQGSESVTVNGVTASGYSYINSRVIGGVTYAQGVQLTAPAVSAVVRISYTKIAGFRAMRPTAGVFDSAARVEVNATGELDLNGGWWPGNAQTIQAGIAATATSANSITASTLALAIDQYRGYTITVTADATTPTSVGQTMVIKYHTATAFTFGGNWAVTPSVGAVFSITDTATQDGLHPSTRMHIEMARAIDPSLF